MPEHTTNYTNTFIEIAPDSDAVAGTIPPLRGDKPTVAGLQYEMIAENPYRYTSDEVIFGVYAQRKDLLDSEMEEQRAQFFAKGQPCLRASALTKKYGWGVHYNKEGKMALYGRETEAYQNFMKDTDLQQVFAMRSKRK